MAGEPKCRVGELGKLDFAPIRLGMALAPTQDGGLDGGNCRQKLGTNPSDFWAGFGRYWGVKVGTVFLKKIGSDLVVQSSR